MSNIDLDPSKYTARMIWTVFSDLDDKIRLETSTSDGQQEDC